MSGISSTAWSLFVMNVVCRGVIVLDFFLEGRSKKGSSQFSGIRIGATLSSPAAWRAGHRAALRWSLVDLVAMGGASIVFMLTMRSRLLVLFQSVLFGLWVVSIGLNVWYANGRAKEVVRVHEEEAEDSPGGGGA